jgi:crotonobetainyl-CoA:carnitine CoA-transferase CaiB-like acyl-CoA transferase
VATAGPGTAPLSGIRVVALEQAVAAPLCTRHLADLGAEVIKVERPGTGDFARAYDGLVHGESAYFVWLNYGKRSLAIDLTTEPGRAVFEALLGTADVLVHNLGPGAVDRLGYDPPGIRRRWPALIDCAISGYGPDGPYGAHKAFDLLLQGESGLTSVTGTPDAPARVGISIADICAGTYALAAVLAALIERTGTGLGRHLDIAMLDGLADWLGVPALQARYGGGAPPRTGLHHPGIAPYGPYRTGDGGTVLVAVQNDGQWRRLCERVLERPDLTADRRFDRNERRVAHRAELDAAIEARLVELDRAELERRLSEADVPFGALNSIAELLDHPQLRSRERWLQVATPSGPATVARSPLGDVRDARVPALGEDTDAILTELGLSGR